MAGSSGYSIKIRRRKKRRKAEKKLNKGLFAVLALVAVLGIASKYLSDNSEKIYNVFAAKNVKTITPQTYLEGVKIDGIDIGGLTYQQAETLLKESVDTTLDGNAVVIKSTDGRKQ